MLDIKKEETYEYSCYLAMKGIVVEYFLIKNYFVKKVSNIQKIKTEPRQKT